VWLLLRLLTLDFCILKPPRPYGLDLPSQMCVRRNTAPQVFLLNSSLQVPPFSHHPRRIPHQLSLPVLAQDIFQCFDFRFLPFPVVRLWPCEKLPPICGRLTHFFGGLFDASSTLFSSFFFLVLVAPLAHFSMAPVRSQRLHCGFLNSPISPWRSLIRFYP